MEMAYRYTHENQEDIGEIFDVDSWKGGEHVERFDFFLNKCLYVIYMPYKTNAKSIVSIYPLITYHERVLIWERARGMWKHKKSDPILELKKMRKEWDRQLLNTLK